MITKEAIEAAARAMCEAWHYSKIGMPDGDAEWARKQDQYRTQARAALTAALAVMPGPAVKVRELVWEDDGRVSRAKAVIGIYMVRPCLATAYAGQWVLDGINDPVTLHPSPQAAKAAAQADYEARILSALTPVPDLASENERLRAALEKLERYVAMSCFDQWLPEGHTKTSGLSTLLDYCRAALEERT